MDTKIESCTMFMLLFLVIMFGPGIGAAEDTVKAYSSSHMDHMDPQLMVFFTMNNLKLGHKMPIYFPKKDPSSSPQFLPKEEADSIPFSYDKLQYLLHFFSATQGTPQAQAIADTLRQCAIKPIEGEIKFCANSLESMIEFVQNTFGLDSHFQVLSTKHFTKSGITLQNYTVVEMPEEVAAPKIVACHTIPYPYAVFYCHSQESENKVFKVLLVGDNGDRVEAVAVCHMDTSHWSRKHASFRVLGIEPGSSHVCHFFPEDNLVWVPEPTLISDA
ncbi:hypothetical protein HS088_TW07G01293 [Tripterygium wilfordii]|uniref:BURP domain-containing protein n=1 Tax=Tripterygium wilfordii TaxID=458696 RepID=A0A7J7DH77_TRIWF|nr:BURP domain protein USPL1-like isoform X2 [Tripterygium wilfordii]KAF5745701.1 hypothetical protein HS088_TW07G01293 [Tripterygium wilfordii]